MPTARTNGLTLAYEVYGEPAAPPMLLIMGLGGQLIHWHWRFCELLVARGFRVIRFDNRDAGCSTVLSAHAPYQLSDMAADTVGLLDALGIERAHVLGMSMGGMIAQVMAIAHPQRVRSLTCLMTTPGGPDFPPPDPMALLTLLEVPPRDREGFARRTLRVGVALNAGAHPLDEERVMALGREAFERGYHPEGVARQTAAVLASGSRLEALRGVRTPTLVVHGALDPLVPVSASRAIAEAVPGARLVVVPQMGHYLPPQVWGAVLEEVTSHALAAERIG